MTSAAHRFLSSHRDLTGFVLKMVAVYAVWFLIYDLWLLPDGRLDAALSEFGPDPRSAVVCLSHDPKIDTPALDQALKSEAFYIGALGSLRTQAKRRAELERLGHPPDRVARIKGPVGLDIGAATPAEIAISIMAEMTQTLRQQD